MTNRIDHKPAAPSQVHTPQAHTAPASRPNAPAKPSGFGTRDTFTQGSRIPAARPAQQTVVTTDPMAPEVQKGFQQVDDQLSGQPVRNVVAGGQPGSDISSRMSLIKTNGKPDYFNNCANFASSFLASIGHKVPGSGRDGDITGAPNLFEHLGDAAAQAPGKPWSKVGGKAGFPPEMLPTAPDYKLTPEQQQLWKANMKPGSPVFFATLNKDGSVNPNGHVVIYRGLSADGQPMFTGANSVQPGGQLTATGEQEINTVSYGDLMSWMGSRANPKAGTITSAFSYDG